MLKNLSILLLALMGSFTSQADHLSDVLQLTARMSGANEVPAVTTDAQGVGIFTLDSRKNTLSIDVSVAGLSGDITGIHFHEGAIGENGGVVHNLSDFVSGNRIRTTLKDLTPDDVSKFLSGAYYINVHTAANPGGEIRGQVLLETDFRYSAMLSGDQEVPAVATNAFGIGVFNLSKSGYKLQIKVVVDGLSGPINAAHFHNAAFGVNGGVVEDLGPFINGNVITATVDPTAYLDELRAGNIYINVHTTDNPGGEIRGQVMLADGLYFDAFLNGAQENPAVVTNAEGVAVITVSSDLSTVSYNVALTGLSGPITGAHFHGGGAGINGGVVLNLTNDVNGNRIMGSADLTPQLLNAMLRGDIYLNVHTAANPGGEIRGQVYKLAREAYSYQFSGGQEVPAVTTAATGAGMVTIDRDQTNAHFMMVVSGLETDFTAAHFHNARPGVNGGVIYNLASYFNAGGGAYGYWTEDDATTPFDHSLLFRNNEVYVNVHTMGHPGGEIRANIARGRDFFGNLPIDPRFSNDLLITARLNGEQEVPAVTTDALGVASFMVNDARNEITVNVSVNGLSGPITGIHIHEGAVGENGGVVIALNDFVVGNRVQAVLTEITADEMKKFLTGAYYLNVHTSANPGGEIRGQLLLETDPTYRANLSGGQEVPAVTTDALGVGTFNYTNVINQLEINVMLTGLSGPITGVHLHEAAAGTNGGVVEDLMSFVRGNRIQGVVVPGDYLAALKAGNIYINVHTAANPGGEIRGQLTLDNNLTFDTWLSGGEETPPVATAAGGFAAVSLMPDFSSISVSAITNGLSGVISGTHFHKGGLGNAGGVVLNLSPGIDSNVVMMTVTDAAMITPDLINDLLTGNIYLNVHTAGFPAGEIRGQVYRLARDGYGYDLCTAQETGAIDAPFATGGAITSIDRHNSNAHIMAVVSGLTGDITGAHIHEAAIGENGGVVVPIDQYFNNGGAFAYLGADEFTPRIANTIKDGNNYINVHTAMHPAGEIRGQIIKDLTCALPVAADERTAIFQELQLSPVPTTNVLNVDFTALSQQDAQLSIYDLAGRKVFTKTYKVNESDNRISLDVSWYVPGFYVVSLSDGVNVVSEKFVK